MDLEESPERLAAYRALALEYPRRFAELLEKAQAEAGTAAREESPSVTTTGYEAPPNHGHALAIERMLTVTEFAELSRLSRPTIYRQIDQGNIEAIRIGGTIRIAESVARRVLGRMSRPVPSTESRQSPQSAQPESGQDNGGDYHRALQFPAVRFQPAPPAAQGNGSKDEPHQ